ncbi:MAG: hypothetical protein ACLU80_00310, partial [Dorea sp.]
MTRMRIPEYERSQWKVDLLYAGFVYDNVSKTNGAWYVKNGQIDFGANSLSRIRLRSYLILSVVNGYVNHELYTVAQGTINGETAWWCVEGRSVDAVPNGTTGTAEYGKNVCIM